MYLITREISEYTHHRIVLGVYTNEIKAKEARQAYLESCKLNDPWAEQAYRDVDVVLDTKITDISEETENIETTENIYLVILMEDGFGQDRLEVVAYFDTDEKAKKYADKSDEAEHEWANSWHEVHPFELNKFYPQ